MATTIFKNKGTEKYLIKVKDPSGKEVDFDTSVDIEADPGYTPVGKLDTTLSGLPGEYQKQPITWFTNFGVNGPTSAANPKKLQKGYKVTIQKPPEGKTLCIYDDTQPAGQKVVVLGPGGISYTENKDTISFYLDLVDPPTGIFP